MVMIVAEQGASAPSSEQSLQALLSSLLSKKPPKGGDGWEPGGSQETTGKAPKKGVTDGPARDVNLGADPIKDYLREASPKNLRPGSSKKSFKGTEGNKTNLPQGNGQFSQQEGDFYSFLMSHANDPRQPGALKKFLDQFYTKEA